MPDKSTEQGNTVAADYLFEDVESFEASFHGLDLELRQLDCGSFRGAMRVLSTPSLVLAECALNRQLEQRGAPRIGHWTFGFPAGDGFRMRWRGHEVDSRSVMVFRPDEEIDCKSDARFHAFSMTIPEDRMIKGAERLVWFREVFPGYESIFPHTFIASFLGITPVTLSRLRNATG